MYVPEAFAETRAEVLHDLMRRFSFGTLISTGPDGIVATHLPFLLDEGRGQRGTLLGHFARANPHWRSLDPTKEVLAIFQGPHAYVSPSWYTTAPAVPTWNYAVVHCYGRPRLIEDPAQVRDVLTKTVTAYESGMTQPWRIDSLPSLYAQNMAAAVVAFEIDITRLEGKWKLNQNRSAADRDGVIAALAQQDDPMARQVAQLMRERMNAAV
jgi:transcriptional regulator